MATKQPTAPSIRIPYRYEEYAAQELKGFYRMGGDHHVPAANHTMKVGDLVQNGRDGTGTIVEILDNGRIIHFSYPSPYPAIEQVLRPRYQWWIHVEPLAPIEETNFCRPRIRVQFRQTQLRTLLWTCYSRGLVDSPDYQRDYTWTLADKQRLIRSIFDRCDIGKFIFLEYMDRMEYEVIDGKQRLRALMDYYEGRFEYEGKTYQQLSWYDKHAFGDLSVGITELDEQTIEKSDILWLFLSINAAGVPQTEEHLAKVTQMYQDIMKAEAVGEAG